MQSKRAPQLLLLLAFGCSLIFAFPHDPQPISLVNNDYYTRCPVFVGRRAGRNGSGSGSRPHILDFQLMLRLGRWLLIAEREHIFGLQLDAITGRELFYHKKLTWRASRQERKTCSMKGKSESECRNFIKVLLPRSDSLLFICGTNAYNPTCRLYLEDSLEQTGKNVSGMAKCPYDSRQSNVALFADDKLYTATVTDFLALDAVVYRSLSEPALRSLKHDSRWLKEPHFVRALEYGEHVYFFLREIAVEFTALGKIVDLHKPEIARPLTSQPIIMTAGQEESLSSHSSPHTWNRCSITSISSMHSPSSNSYASLSFGVTLIMMIIIIIIVIIIFINYFSDDVAHLVSNMDH